MKSFNDYYLTMNCAYLSDRIKQIIECRSKKLHDGTPAVAAAYQPMAGGEAVVWLLIPVAGFGLGVDALSAWGLDPGDFISVWFNSHFICIQTLPRSVSINHLTCGSAV